MSGPYQYHPITLMFCYQINGIKFLTGAAAQGAARGREGRQGGHQAAHTQAQRVTDRVTESVTKFANLSGHMDVWGSPHSSFPNFE